MRFLVDLELTKPPSRKDGDAGFDFFVPFDTPAFREEFLAANPNDGWSWVDGGIAVAPQGDVLVPSFVRARMLGDVALVAHNKSGVATKQHFDVGAQVVDSSYEGVVHLHVTNVSRHEQVVGFGQKLVQFVPVVVDVTPFEVFDSRKTSKELFYDGHDSHRGDKGFGNGTGLT